MQLYDKCKKIEKKNSQKWFYFDNLKDLLFVFIEYSEFWVKINQRRLSFLFFTFVFFSKHNNISFNMFLVTEFNHDSNGINNSMTTLFQLVFLQLFGFQIYYVVSRRQRHDDEKKTYCQILL